jgi:large-conductance mechanosensitive channel
MLSLSSQYSAATTDAQRAAILGAGEAMVAIFHGTAFQVSYILGSIAGFLIAAAMLRSNVFSRTTAYLRIGSSVFDFGIFIPGIGLFISLLSVVFLLVFNIMVARKFFQLGSAPGKQMGDKAIKD